MAEFINHKTGSRWQSIPVCTLFTCNLEYLHHYTEYPASYEKDRIVGRMQEETPGVEGRQRYLAGTGLCNEGPSWDGPSRFENMVELGGFEPPTF